jgi:hypothetical protein
MGSSLAAKLTALLAFTPMPDIRAKDTTKSEASNFQRILISIILCNELHCLRCVVTVDMDHRRRIWSDSASDPTKPPQRTNLYYYSVRPKPNPNVKENGYE